MPKSALLCILLLAMCSVVHGQNINNVQGKTLSAQKKWYDKIIDDYKAENQRKRKRKTVAKSHVTKAEDHVIYQEPKATTEYEDSIASESTVEHSSKVYDVVEQMPSFPGGQAALMQYLSTHVKYPAVAEENGIQGRVTVGFVINTDGSISDAKIMKSVDPSLDKEAVRVVTTMPRWIPGKQNGEPVRVKYFIPVVFRLR